MAQSINFSSLLPKQQTNISKLKKVENTDLSPEVNPINKLGFVDYAQQQPVEQIANQILVISERKNAIQNKAGVYQCMGADFSRNEFAAIPLDTTTNSVIVKSIGINAKSMREGFLNDLLAENGDSMDKALPIFLEDLASTIYKSASNIFSFKEANPFAAIECARLWHNDKRFSVLNGEEIEAAFRYAAYHRELKIIAYNAFSVDFFCNVLQAYLEARESAISILKHLSNSQNNPTLMLEDKTIQHLNEKTANFYWSIFRNDVEAKKSNTDPAKVNTQMQASILGILKKSGITTSLTGKNKYQLLQDYSEIKKDAFAESFDQISSDYKNKREDKVRCAVLLAIKHYADCYLFDDVEIKNYMIEMYAGFIGEIKDVDCFISNYQPSVQEKAKTYYLNISGGIENKLWYNYLVKNIDFEKLPVEKPKPQLCE